MRTVPFRRIFNGVARWMGFNPNKEIPPDDREAIVDRINARVRTIWSAWPWPEWTATEQRAFRQVWNDSHQYLIDTGDGTPDEVFYVETGLYYGVSSTLIADPAPIGPPIGTTPLDATWWTPLDSSVVGSYIQYDQPCRRSIGQVSGVYAKNPSGCGSCNGNGAGLLRFHPSERGVEICNPGNPTVYINYRMPVPRYSMEPYAAGRTYFRADTVVDPVSGECYQALRTTLLAPGTSDWSRLPFLEAWEGFVVSGAYADALNELDREGNAETQLLELKAARAEERANNAVESELDSLTYQGQALEWTVCKRKGYWCESAQWGGGDVLEIDEECQDGIVFPSVPPTTGGGGGGGGGGIVGCPTPDQCPDIAYISQENLFEDVNTFPGIRLGTLDIIANYALTVTNFETGANASAGALTAYLPQALGSGQAYHIVKTDPSINPVTVLPQSGDTISGMSSFVLGAQGSDLLIIDGGVGQWRKIGLAVNDPNTGFAEVDGQNQFSGYNSFPSIALLPQIVNFDYDVGQLDFAVFGMCVGAPIALTLPVATGSGLLYLLGKLDSTDDNVTIQAQTGDTINGANSVALWDQFAVGLIYDVAPNFWLDIGTSIGDTVGAATSDVGWWYRPEIGNDTALKAWPSLGNPVNSRIDVVYPDGLRTYVLRPLAADPTDPGQVQPNDFDAALNNVHWSKI